MNDQNRDAAYHDAHIDDSEEWDMVSPEEVSPRPTGMTVFSLRLPIEEFALLKQEATRRHTSMSEFTRMALRGYLLPRAMGSLSVTATGRLQVTSQTPMWVGGRADDVRRDFSPLVGSGGAPA